MKTIIFASLLFISSALFSQTTEIENSFMSTSGELYSLNYLNSAANGRGNTGVGSTNDILGAMMNPAALRLKAQNQAGLQYSYKTTQSWHVSHIFGGYNYETKHMMPSVYVAYGRKINKNITAGFVYYNPVSQKNDFAGTPFSLDDDDFFYEYTIHSFNVPVSYDLRKISLGINLNFGYYRNFLHGVTTLQEPDKFSDEVNTFTRFNVQGGILFTPIENFSAGVTFTPGFKAYPESDIEEVFSNIKVVSTVPMRIGAGIKYTPIKNKLNLYFDYNFVQTSDLEAYKDRHDFNFGGDVIVNKNLTLRAGAFTFLDNRDFLRIETFEYQPEEGEYGQIFLTFGATALFKNIEITGSIMDSHLSGGVIKVTHINLGTVVNF